MKIAPDLVGEAKQRIQNLSVEQVEAEVSNGAALIDLREESERAASGAIPGAVHVPRGMLEFAASAGTPYHRPEFAADARIILHCAGGGRSALAADTLQNMGYTNVAHLETGFGGWAEAGKPVEQV